MKHRNQKRTEYEKELIAEFIQRQSNGTSLVTVTRLDADTFGDTAVIYLSVLPETQEKAVIDFVERNLSELRHFVMGKIPSGRIPFFSVDIDRGEKLRQKIDTLEA